MNLILFADTISGRQESRPHDGFSVEKKTWQFLVDDWLLLLLESWPHGACKCVWFCCGLDFCYCTLFWNSPTSLSSSLLNYEVLWPCDRMSGWDDMTMKWDIFRAFQPQRKILDNAENINIWGRSFRQKIIRPKPFCGETGINKRFSISVWRKNMFS